MIVTVKSKQSLMDVTTEKYGQIDNLVSVSNDNGISISEFLETNQELTVNNENKGDNEIKDKIITQKLSFNNDFNPSAYNFSLWFLPSRDELDAMYTELKVNNLGNLVNGNYWSSSENSSTASWLQLFTDGSQSVTNKSLLLKVRACRSFTSNTVLNLKEIGPGGGYIFYKNENEYLEAAPSDQGTSVWSNIINVAVTGTGLIIGTGENNTELIINQSGHVNSAAKLCNDLN